MNTIYDGTFTIGQTSATNFQAGPGISITQPSEGTVRIANDETVLFSGLNTSGTITLSEDSNNFERIRVLYSINDGIRNSCEVIPQTQGVYVGMNTLAFYASYVRAKGIKYTLSGNTLVPDTSAGLYRGGNNANVTASTELASQAFRVDAVIGINRKANA